MWAVRGLHKSAVEGKLNSVLLFYYKKTFLYGAAIPNSIFTFRQLKLNISLLSTSYLILYLCKHHFLLFPPAVLKRPAPEDTVTASFGKFISEVKPQHLSSVVLHRSKRMVLDSIGVGVIGSTTDVFELALQHCQVRKMGKK